MSHPAPSLAGMEPNTGHTCQTKPETVAGITVLACESCRNVAWRAGDDPLDPAQAVAALFGSFTLVGRLPAIGAPGDVVLAYRTSSSRKRRTLDALPRRVWLQVGPDLWLAHDGETLLLATPHGLLLENLTRGGRSQANWVS